VSVLVDRGLLACSDGAGETEEDMVQKRSHFGYCLPVAPEQEIRHYRSTTDRSGLTTGWPPPRPEGRGFRLEFLRKTVEQWKLRDPYSR